MRFDGINFYTAIQWQKSKMEICSFRDFSFFINRLTDISDILSSTSISWHAREVSVLLRIFHGSVARGWCFNPSKINNTFQVYFQYWQMERQLQTNSSFNWNQWRNSNWQGFILHTSLSGLILVAWSGNSKEVEAYFQQHFLKILICCFLNSSKYMRNRKRSPA